MSFEIILSMAGGLGLFLFGMTVMSESIEKVAGAKLRSILEMFTTNRFTGLVVGIIFTGIIQSSSACTVMVVSFVNSGLMSLYQAAGVIYGANIGTTITSQLVSFNLSEAAPIILLAGVLTMMLGKGKQNAEKIGEVIVGFGILFMGLSGMSGAMEGMKDSPGVMQLLSSLHSPILAVLMGTVLTAIIQSSSVTVSIVLLMANEGLLGLPISLFIILGCNIGACASALLASMTGKKDAKRAAMIHFLFNVIGTVLFYIILMVGMEYVIDGIMSISGGNAGRFVANAHTIIKIFQVIMLFPFSNAIVKLTYVLVPGDDKKVGYRDSFQLKYIGEKVVFNPATAVVEVMKEIERMASLATENLNRAMNALITLDNEDIEDVYEVEKNINFLNHSITNYLVKINQATLPIEDLKSIGALFHVVNDIERIGDHAENVADSAKQRIGTDVNFSKEAQRGLGEMLDMVNNLIQYSLEMFSTGTEDHLEDIMRLEDAVDEKERELQKDHVGRLTRNECSPEAGMLFSDIVSGLERVADHATNIAFSILNAEREE
ncbi:phosphate-specific transport system accessory protein PhoU [Lachnospiraceae bacterium]|jgi:phosphate:Na+ symporter|nr:Na/Pi cotransporter family protein [Lachnospiraceae bacterium]MCI9107294.1 Na/Pi cotransporter family protein [Lachnospiraceae bacterium]GFH91650.1 phosphate-specific transport system accessory protein PhoU [Lachnospiraceae bacterium]